MRLRRITPIPMAGIVTPDLGPKPSVEWVKPTDLYVDGTYQRDLSRRSGQLIAKLVKEFAWNRMKLPIVVRAGDKMHVLDGQHTAIVAATLRIPEIPVFVVVAESVDERARAFVGHNTDRIRVSTVDIHHALVASGDPDAMDVDAVCRRAKVRIRMMNQLSAVAEGDTMAVGTISKMVKSRGVIPARQVLEVLVKAKRAPINSVEIKAVEQIMCVERRGVDLDKLVRIIRADGDSGIRSAQSHAKIARIPFWKALVARWVEKVPNVRRVA
jgi:hypothetical protein